MAFKKIDEAAAATAQPLDGYLLQGVVANLDAARSERGKRAAMTYQKDARPVLGCSRVMLLPLGPWPLSRGCTQVTVTVRGSCASASVYLDPIILTDQGFASVLPTTGQTRPERSPLSEFAVGDDVLTMTLETRGYNGTVILGLLIQSDRVNDAGTKTNRTGGTETRGANPTEWDLGATPGLTFTLGKRYSLTYADHSVTPQGVGIDGFPGPYEVLDWDDLGTRGTTDRYVHCYPPVLTSWTTELANYAITQHELGVLTVYGISVEETAFETNLDLGAALEPAYSAAARTVAALYQRERDLWVERGPIHHFGGCYDPAHLDPASSAGRLVQCHGAVVDIAATARIVGSCFVGPYTDESVVVQGATVYRQAYRVSVLLAAGWTEFGTALSRDHDVARVEIEARLYSWSGTAWEDDVASETLPVARVKLHNYLRAGSQDNLGALIAKMGPAEGSATTVRTTPLAWHTLRPCLPANLGPGDVTLVEGVIYDTSPAALRMLVLYLSHPSGFADSEGGIRLDGTRSTYPNAWVWVPSFCVSSAREVGGP